MSAILEKSDVYTDGWLENQLNVGNIDFEWKLGIKNNWRIRSDKNRVLLVEITEKVFEIGKYHRLVPQEAILAAMLDGKKTITDLVTEAADLFSTTSESVSGFIKPFLKNLSEALTINPEKISRRSYELEKLIIPSNEVDCLTTRNAYPLSMILHISDSCNRNCIYCNVQKRPSNKECALTTEQLFNVIDQASEAGVMTVSIAGGEPFLRNDIPELIERIYKNDMACGFSTKAYISPEMAERLKNVGVEYAQVSLDAPDEKIADLLAGSIGFYKDAIATIKNLRNVGIQVRTNSIITPFNVRMIGDLVELLASLGVYYISLTSASRSLHNGAISDSLFLNHRDGKWLENEVRRLQTVYKDSPTEVGSFEMYTDYNFVFKKTKEKMFKDRANCSAGRSAFLVLEDGKVVLCEECPVCDELVFGNVKEQSLQEIWDSPKIQEFLHPPREKYIGTVCYDCTDYDECHDVKGRCWRESLKAYGEIYAPAPMCPYAPTGKKVF